MPPIGHVDAAASATMHRVLQDSEDPSLNPKQDSLPENAPSQADMPAEGREISAVVDQSAPINRVLQEAEDPSLNQVQTPRMLPEEEAGYVIDVDA